MPDRDSLTTVDPLLERLDAAEDDLAAIQREIDDIGEPQVERVADAYERATSLLDSYEETATGSGRETFQQYLEFQSRFVDLVDDLDDDLPTRDAFETANDLFDKRRLSESDFQRGRDLLEPASDLAALLTRRERVRERRRDARHAIQQRLAALEDRIDELERLERLADADLDAPVEQLRDPIAAYNDAVRDAFATFKRESSARAVLAFVAATDAYPLVDYRQPPADLKQYVESHPAGEEPIPTLLDYADYSNSKLSHYVDDPGTLKARVAVDRTYLERLNADPLTVAWPPSSAPVLRRCTEELIPVVARFAPESTVARLRTVRDLTFSPDRFERLRRAAVAREQLSSSERDRVVSGAVADELAAVRDARDRLRDALGRDA
jgi:hypothetical protein